MTWTWQTSEITNVVRRTAQQNTDSISAVDGKNKKYSVRYDEIL